MDSSVSFSSKQHQVVPQRDRSCEDDERINQIAMMLQNPSPSYPKPGFDFSRSESFSNFAQFAALFSPSLGDGLSFNNTPTSQASGSQPSPFAVSTSNGAFLGSMVPGTPIQNPAAPQSEAAPGSVSSTSTVVTVAVNDAKKAKVEAESKSGQATDDSDHDDHDDESESEGEQEHEDGVPSGEDDEEDSDSSYRHNTDSAPKRRKRKATQPISTTARCFADLTDDDIAFMDFKDLTRMMATAGLSRQAIAETKARRRRLKNRQSARLCSNKKREMCQELATDKTRLQDQLTAIQQAFNRLQRDHLALKQQHEALLRQSR